MTSIQGEDTQEAHRAQTINIACAADVNYLPHCAAMLNSVADMAGMRQVSVFFMARPSLPEEDKNRFASFLNGKGIRLTWILVRDDQLRSFPENRRYGYEAWMRLLLPELLPETDKVLYLDADLIVNAPLSELYDLEMHNACLAAVPCAQLPGNVDWPKKLGLGHEGKYFNSGVLLMNLQRMRREQSVRKFKEFARTHADMIRWPDQDVLNLTFDRSYLLLPLRWNMVSSAYVNRDLNIAMHGKEAYFSALHMPAIVHFTGDASQKPWHFRCNHPLKAIYWKNLRVTPWANLTWEGRNMRNAILRHLPLKFSWWLSEAISRLRGKSKNV